MPIVSMTAESWKANIGKLLIAGQPNSGKTFSLLTAPRPIHILAYPGEEGWATIKPDPEAGVFLYAYHDVGAERPSSSTVLSEVETLTWEILGGKHGPIRTFAGDGIHKFGEYALDKVTDGAYFKGVDFEAKLYGLASKIRSTYMRRILNSQVENKIFTIWVAPERDKDQSINKDKAIMSHIWPNLPGQDAKRILGEFTATVYATTAAVKPGAPRARVWQLLPDDEVWGLGVKVPKGTAIPKYVPQEWEALMKVLRGEVGQAAPPAQLPTPPPHTGAR